MEVRIQEVSLIPRRLLRSLMRWALGMNKYGVVKPFVCFGPVRVVDLNMMVGDFWLCPGIFVNIAVSKHSSPNVLSSSEILLALRRPCLVWLKV